MEGKVMTELRQDFLMLMTCQKLFLYAYIAAVSFAKPAGKY